MKSWKRSLCVAGLCVAALFALGAITSGGLSVGPFGLLEVASSSPIDSQDLVIVPVATAATAAPYQPHTVTVGIPMGKYSGFVVYAEYLRGETLTTDSVSLAWGVLADGSHVQLKTSGGSVTITSADAATDFDDGRTYKRTAPSDQIDALGCPDVKVTVSTAAVSSASGAVRLRVKRF